MKRLFAPAGMLAITADTIGVEIECVLAQPIPFEEHGDFAVVTVTGPLMQHAAPIWDSYESICSRVDAALSSSRPAVMLKICSPGGQVAGAFELVEEIRTKAQRAGKRIVAYVDGMAASAAYALACAAECIYVPATGIVGSIGCIQIAVDETAADRARGLNIQLITSGERKADGNPHTPITDAARAAMQSGVDDMAVTFFATVAAARRLSIQKIADLEAAVFVGAKAVVAGLADEVATFAEVVGRGAQQITAGAAGAEANMTDEEKAKAALQAIADGKDEKAAAKAKKALAAYEEDDGDDTKAEGDDDGDADADADKPKDDDESKDDDKDKKSDDADAKAATTASTKMSPSLDLAASVQSLTAWKAAQEAKAERSDLMAKRPDLAPEVVAFLAKQPIEVVRDAVKQLPRGVSGAKSQVKAAIAALSPDVQPTAGATAGEATGLDPKEHEELRRLMGIAPKEQPTGPIRTASALILPTVPPSVLRQQKAALAANGGK